MITFKDKVNSNNTLTVQTGRDCVILTVELKDEDCTELVNFYMNPLDFGDFAVALWECSPSKPPIRIEEAVPNEEGNKGTDSSSQIPLQFQSELEYRYPYGLTAEESAAQGRGPAPDSDKGIDKAGA